jgi:hypothetical protein
VERTTGGEGAYGTRRGARRLARFAPGSGPAISETCPRVRFMGPPGLNVAVTPAVDRGAGGEWDEKNRRPWVRGRAVSGPWYHPTSRPRGGRLCPHGACARCGGSITGAGSPGWAPAAAYCDASLRVGSGRSSEVLFAGGPGPALQLPRFSGPLAPGTRPRRRFGLRLWEHTIRCLDCRQAGPWLTRGPCPGTSNLIQRGPGVAAVLGVWT